MHKNAKIILVSYFNVYPQMKTNFGDSNKELKKERYDLIKKLVNEILAI
jgi:hypothetical protein